MNSSFFLTGKIQIVFYWTRIFSSKLNLISPTYLRGSSNNFVTWISWWLGRNRLFLVISFQISLYNFEILVIQFVVPVNLCNEWSCIRFCPLHLYLSFSGEIDVWNLIDLFEQIRKVGSHFLLLKNPTYAISSSRPNFIFLARSTFGPWPDCPNKFSWS